MSVIFALGLVTSALPIAGVSTADGPQPATDVLEVRLGKAAFGLSGALRARVVQPGGEVAVPLVWPAARPLDVWYRWVPALGTVAPTGRQEPLPRGDIVRAPTEPGVYELEVGAGAEASRLEDYRLVVRVPLERKRGGFLQGYFIGSYPGEAGEQRDRYAAPAGFIEVTPANQDLRLSEHFRLKEFLTHDQAGVWPKYVVVDPRLIDKLELVMAELEAMGIPADRMVVMSGFRTPQYNRKGLDQGRATLSRHQYGDAADVWVDNDGDWYMDDLNRDGRRDPADARVMLRAVERIEARHPELIGGAGVYQANGVHGPFLHVDVRGRAARW